jgi:hypothetical protein
VNEGKARGIQALDREIETGAAAIQEYLGAIQEREHALSLHAALMEADEELDPRDAGWHKKEVERLDDEATAAEQRVRRGNPRRGTTWSASATSDGSGKPYWARQDSWPNR